MFLTLQQRIRAQEMHVPETPAEQRFMSRVLPVIKEGLTAMQSQPPSLQSIDAGMQQLKGVVAELGVSLRCECDRQYQCAHP